MTRISEEHAKKLGIVPADIGDGPAYQKRKFNNKKPEIDGHKFHSQKEASFYMTLKWAKEAGEIEELELQPRIRLQDGFDDKEGNHHRPINYFPDFRVRWADETEEFIDVKGSKETNTAVYKIKKKLMLKKYPDINFREVYNVPEIKT